jgi:hypothetical protein
MTMGGLGQGKMTKCPRRGPAATALGMGEPDSEDNIRGNGDTDFALRLLYSAVSSVNESSTRLLFIIHTPHN